MLLPVLLFRKHGADFICRPVHLLLPELHTWVLALGLHQAGDSGVPHGSQRMVLHGALMQRHTANIQFPVSYHTPVDRQGRAQYRIGHPKEFQGGVRNRTNISLWSRVKGGTVFQIKFLHALLLQPAKGPHGIRHCFPGILGPGFKRYHNGLYSLRNPAFFCRNPVKELDRHASLYQK